MTESRRMTGTVNRRPPVVTELTPLNRRVTARFLRCGDEHIPGKEFVTRWTGKDYRSFPVCKVCRVPMIPRKWRWADHTL